MTVASLWKALERAGCGKAVGYQDLVNLKHPLDKTNPWNYNEVNRSRLTERPTLAVDLSIWICESLTSAAMSLNHANPPLQLVYARTVKLLSLGIKLIMVVEGKRRVRRTQGEDGDDKYQRRRSGTKFWKACESCIEMLKMMGVPVFRAAAEGEALCALLNQRGIVDGVVSNDGDCLLFGAKVLFTKFSNENLENSKVIRYDANDIRALVVDCDDSDEDLPDEAVDKAQTKIQNKGEIINLSREDLIAFALLTGSDLAGNGLSKVGMRKALRFIRKCQVDNPLTPSAAAINELKSWARAASVVSQLAVPEGSSDSRTAHCSCCCHPGSTVAHKKHGCKLCGTNPGEACFRVSPGGRFRKSLRAKALAVRPKFDPTFVVLAYNQPNKNQVPFNLVGKTSATLEMALPKLNKMLRASLIVRGHSLAESRSYIRQSLAKLVARTYLFNSAQQLGKNASSTIQLSQGRPVPQKITKELFQKSTPCYEVLWKVSATITDEDGNCVDGYEFLTVENRELIRKCHPDLVQTFKTTENERKKQGDSEQVRRRAFLINSLFGSNDQQRPDKILCRKKRHRFFQKKFQRPGNSSNTQIGEQQFSSKGESSKPRILNEVNVFRQRIAPALHGSTPQERNEGNSDVSVRRSAVDLDQEDTQISTIASHMDPDDSSNTWPQIGRKEILNSLALYAEARLTPGHLHFLAGQSHRIQQENSLHSAFSRQDPRKSNGVEYCDKNANHRPTSKTDAPLTQWRRIDNHGKNGKQSWRFENRSQPTIESSSEEKPPFRLPNDRGQSSFPVRARVVTFNGLVDVSSTENRNELAAGVTAQPNIFDQIEDSCSGELRDFNADEFPECYSSPPQKRSRQEPGSPDEHIHYNLSIASSAETPIMPKQLTFFARHSEYPRRRPKCRGDEDLKFDQTKCNDNLVLEGEESLRECDIRWQFGADLHEQFSDFLSPRRECEDFEIAVDCSLNVYHPFPGEEEDGTFASPKEVDRRALAKNSLALQPACFLSDPPMKDSPDSPVEECHDALPQYDDASFASIGSFDLDQKWVSRNTPNYKTVAGSCLEWSQWTSDGVSGTKEEASAFRDFDDIEYSETTKLQDRIIMPSVTRLETPRNFSIDYGQPSAQDDWLLDFEGCKTSNVTSLGIYKEIDSLNYSSIIKPTCCITQIHLEDSLEYADHWGVPSATCQQRQGYPTASDLSNFDDAFSLADEPMKRSRAFADGDVPCAVLETGESNEGFCEIDYCF